MGIGFDPICFVFLLKKAIGMRRTPVEFDAERGLEPISAVFRMGDERLAQSNRECGRNRIYAEARYRCLALRSEAGKRKPAMMGKLAASKSIRLMIRREVLGARCAGHLPDISDVSSLRDCCPCRASRGGKRKTGQMVEESTNA